MKFHFHHFEVLRVEYRPCANPAFEQRIVIRQCIHCPKTEEYPENARLVVNHNPTEEAPPTKSPFRIRP